MGQFFQIGFNKCATSALFRMFQQSGVRSLHSAGRYWRRRRHPQIGRHSPQIAIAENIRAGRPPCEGFEDFAAHFDMEYVNGGRRFENFKDFKAFARAYPRARFLLNTRDKSAWLRSRVRHNDGRYLRKAMKQMRLDEAGVIDAWSADFDRHHDAVREFFALEAGRLLVFDIDKGAICDLADFVAPELSVSPEYWTRVRVTDQVAADHNWTKDIATAA